jgi:hypothetical protein
VPQLRCAEHFNNNRFTGGEVLSIQMIHVRRRGWFVNVKVHLRPDESTQSRRCNSLLYVHLHKDLLCNLG